MAIESFLNRPHFRHHVTHERVGSNPRLMFISGIHGDEGEVGSPLKIWLNRLQASCSGLFPDNIKVFKANPDALNKNKRSVGVPDMNREFMKKKSKYWAVREIKEIFSMYPDLEYVFSFHEETDKFGYRDKKNGRGIEKFERDPNSFYMYDSADPNSSKIPVLALLGHLRNTLFDHGFTLYNGYDDHKKWKKEAVQLNKVTDGYCFQDVNGEKFMDGTFENWVANEGFNGRNKVKRSFVFEIPRDLPIERKQEMIQIILKKFIVPFLNQAYGLNLPEQEIFSI